MTQIELKSTQFRHEREQTWRELEDLIAKVDKNGIRSLTADQLMRLPVLYRATVSSLSVARGISLDANVLAYLENLTERAYLCVYGTRATFLRVAGEFVRIRFPAAVRQIRWHVALAAAFMLFGIVVGWLLTGADESRFSAFVGENVAQERGPGSSAEELRRILYSDREEEIDELHEYATFLFTHNAKIGILAFALGFALGVPTLFVVFSNGLMLGAFGALHQNRGLTVDFWGWILPHGVTELLAIVLCAGAGLVLGAAIVFPGEHTRMQNLARRGRLAGQVVLGAVLMFFIAGLIEGIFRQAVQDVGVRYAVAAATGVFWLAYFSLAGRESGRETPP